ncbi:MAG TPA: VOC family protein [Longimicrobium sp.]|nr:VOC family protein [Longimicrobium sp.]
MAIRIQGLCAFLEVFDMPTSIRFYRDLLGFEVVQKSHEGEDFSWALLRHGDAELMLNTAYDDGARPPAPDRARIAHHRDTALFMGCEDLDSAARYLRTHGLEVDGPTVQAYGMKQVYFLDPDGYNLCLQWPADVTAGA